MTMSDEIIAALREQLSDIPGHVVRHSPQWANTGSFSVCERGKFAHVFAVSYGIYDGYGAFAFFLSDVDVSQPGCGCKPSGAFRQESWQQSKLDEALNNVGRYARLAVECKFNDLPRGGVHLSWTAEQMKKHAY